MYAKVSSSDRKDIVLDTQIPQETAYYVYGQGGQNGIYTDPEKAVLRADTLGGVVLNRTQQYVWERGNILDQADTPSQDTTYNSPNS